MRSLTSLRRAPGKQAALNDPAVPRTEKKGLLMHPCISRPTTNFQRPKKPGRAFRGTSTQQCGRFFMPCALLRPWPGFRRNFLSRRLHHHPSPVSIRPGCK